MLRYTSENKTSNLASSLHMLELCTLPPPLIFFSFHSLTFSLPSLLPRTSLSPPSALTLPHLRSLHSYLLSAYTRALSANRFSAFLHQPIEFRHQPTSLLQPPIRGVQQLILESALADTETISSRYFQRKLRWPRPPNTQISYHLLI
jgi:hypothetical protein